MRRARPEASFRASALRPFIFQFPAIIGRRDVVITVFPYLLELSFGGALAHSLAMLNLKVDIDAIHLMQSVLFQSIGH
jgi:hypothetical protein